MAADWSPIARMAVPENSLGFLLWQVSRRWRRHFKDGLAEIGLTDMDFTMLAGIRVLTERKLAPPTQVNLADYNNVDVMSVSQVVRRLERKGLVIRKRHATDTRAWLLGLTSDGERALADAAVLADRLHESFFGTCDQPALRSALRALLAAEADAMTSVSINDQRG